MYCHDKYQRALPLVFVEMRNIRSGCCRAASFYQIHVILYAQCERARLQGVTTSGCGKRNRAF